MVYVWQNILSKELANHNHNLEGIFTEINLKKTKWLIFGTYRSPNQSMGYFFKHLVFDSDT